MSSLKNYLCLVAVLAFIIIASTGQAQNDMKNTSPFEKMLPPLARPEGDKAIIINSQQQKNGSTNNNAEYIYQPRKAFKLVVSRRRYPKVLPDKSIYGVITLRIDPNYIATSEVIYEKKPYKFDRLRWAIKTGWNETIPFFSRLSAFKKYLKPFETPVYAHFYIKGVKEYPEYPGQYFHWPREELEDYYLYILQKIDAVSSQN